MRYRVNAWGHSELPPILDLDCDEVPAEAKLYPCLEVALRKPVLMSDVLEALDDEAT